MPTRKDSRPLFPLCAILDREVATAHGWTFLDLAAAYLTGGARFLQLRAKQATGAWLLETTSALVALARPAGALVVVNDRADVARLAGADGVHVGQDDLTPAQVRPIVGERAIVGLSTHTTAQIESAIAQPVSYVAIGPVFGSVTKATGYNAVGLDAVRAAAARAATRGLPVVAIGGITLDTAPAVLGAGAASVAVIGDLLATGQPEARVRAYVERLGL